MSGSELAVGWATAPPTIIGRFYTAFLIALIEDLRHVVFIHIPPVYPK
jgi:hypothetical protein